MWMVFVMRRSAWKNFFRVIVACRRIKDHGDSLLCSGRFGLARRRRLPYSNAVFPDMPTDAAWFRVVERDEPGIGPMKTLIKKTKQNGQSLVEYGLLLALIAVLAMLVIKAVGSKTTSTFDNAQSQMTSQGLASTAPIAPSGP